MYSVLAVRDHQRLLELGFGTGSLIRRIAQSSDQVRVTGVDFSRQMVAVASKRNKPFLRQGRVDLHLGNFEDLAFDPECFDTVYCVNTVYFWNNPYKMVQKAYDLLKPGGRLLIGYYDRSDMESMPLSKDVFRLYSAEEMQELLATSFRQDAISQQTHRDDGKPCQCAIAEK